MGRMKKLYELTAEQDKPFLHLMQRTADLTIRCEQVLDLIRMAEFRLNDWLVTHTEEVFEEEPDIDAARGYLNDAIELLEGPHDASNRPSRQATHAG